MFLPIGDAPNPKGTPFVTYALIAANVAAFLLLNVPLGSRQADVSDPAFREYVEVMTRELQGRVDVSRARRPDECLRPLLVRARVPPERPAGHGPAELHVPPRRLHAPLREHAVPLDLRGQRRAEAGGDPVPPLVPAHRRRCDPHPRPRLLLLGCPPRGGFGSHLRCPRLLLPLVPEEHRADARLPPPVPHAGLRDPGEVRAGDVPALRQPRAFPLCGRGRGRARRAHRRLHRRGSRGLAHGPPRRRGPAGRHRGPGSVADGADAASCSPRGRALRRGRSKAYFALPAPATRGVLSAAEAVPLASWLREQGHATPRSSCCGEWCATCRVARAWPRPTPSPG